MCVVGVDSSSASAYQFDRMQQVRLALSSCGLGHVAYQSDRPDRYLVLRLAELFECRTGPVWPTSRSIDLAECSPRWSFTSDRRFGLITGWVAPPLCKLRRWIVRGVKKAVSRKHQLDRPPAGSYHGQGREICDVLEQA